MYVRRCELRHASRNSWRPTLRSCSRSRIVETGGPSHADQLWHGTLSWIRGPFPADRPILTRIPATRWLHQQYPAAASRSSLRGAFAPPASCVCILFPVFVFEHRAYRNNRFGNWQLVDEKYVNAWPGSATSCKGEINTENLAGYRKNTGTYPRCNTYLNQIRTN